MVRQLSGNVSRLTARVRKWERTAGRWSYGKQRARRARSMRRGAVHCHGPLDVTYLEGRALRLTNNTAKSTATKRRARLSTPRSFQRGKLIQTLMVTVWWYCLCLESHRSPRLQLNTGKWQNLLQESANRDAAQGLGSNRPIAMPALAATCFPSSRQTGPSVGGEGHGARSLEPRGTSTRRPDHCARLIVAFEAVLHAPRAGRQPARICYARRIQQQNGKRRKGGDCRNLLAIASDAV